MKVYKVTDCDGYSVSRKLRKNPPKESLINYLTYEWIIPQKGLGPIAIFKSRRKAMRFRNHFNCYGFRIFECEGILSKSICLFDGIKKLYRGNIINGTFLANKVRIIKEIY